MRKSEKNFLGRINLGGKKFPTLVKKIFTFGKNFLWKKRSKFFCSIFHKNFLDVKKFLTGVGIEHHISLPNDDFCSTKIGDTTIWPFSPRFFFKAPVKPSLEVKDLY